MDRALTVLKIVAVVVSIVLGGLKLVQELKRPAVIYSTKDVTTYPLAVKTLEKPEATVDTVMLSGQPVRIEALLIQNLGSKTAHDVFVRIPLAESDGFVGGWVARGDNPITTSMRDQVTEYKFDKLLPNEGVSFYLYLKNANSNLAARVEVYADGSGHRAAWYPYTPLRATGGPALVLQIPQAWLYVLLVVAVILFIPSRAQWDEAKATLLRWRGAADSARAAPPQSQKRGNRKSGRPDSRQ